MRFGRRSQSLCELGKNRSNLRLGCARAQDRSGQGDSSGGHDSETDKNYSPRGFPLRDVPFFSSGRPSSKS